ncbi:hypothetical protein [Solicola sp. PLA-1-18]|uniref:hypothetical protein n=1 Tax=Solicola sp. PLA-1-18 TaxID=3380532 RepID=UPI003B826102
MRTIRPSFLVTIAAVAVATVATSVPASAGTAHHTARCFDESASLTVEQGRLTRPAPQEILRRSTADARVEKFRDDLCRARDARAAERVVVRHGHSLWEWATARAQGRTAVAGDLPGGDDRPLYWARVSMTAALAQWTPARGVDARQRARLQDRLETTSRGQDTVRVPRGKDAKRVIVTGFDPFTLDVDARIGNPSGANALALDGRRIKTDDGWVRVETAMFPVRWDDFAAGEVERTLAPFVRRGKAGLDVLATVSQGSPGEFDLEVWNGANRGGFGDNENLERTGIVPIPAGVPTVRPQPQFTRTNLPVDAMAARSTGAYPVVVNHEIVERDPATGTERTTTEGPTPGFEAVSGGGGDYLSNEIAYRATLLRDAKRAGNVGGHIHTPVLGLPGAGVVTDADYEARRAAIVEQTTALVRAAVDLS